MFRIVKKQELNPTVTKMVIEAPLIARKAEPAGSHQKRLPRYSCFLSKLRLGAIATNRR